MLSDPERPPSVSGSPDATHVGRAYRIRLLLIILLIFLGLTYLHDITKMLLVEKNSADFAHDCFFSEQLSRGVNIYGIKGDRLAELKAASPIPTTIGGKAEYSPIFYWLMIPFTWLPFWRANFIWFLLKHLSLAGCLALLAAILKGGTEDRLFRFGLLGVVFLASQPLREELALGQVHVVILLLLILVGYFQKEGKHHVLSGVIFAFALLTKPQYGLLLLGFLLWRRYAFCFSTVTAYVLFRAVGIAACGVAIEGAYWQNLWGNLADANTGTLAYNISLQALFTRLGSGALPHGYAILCYVGVALLLCALTFWRVRRGAGGDFLLAYAGLICLVTLVSPRTWEFHLIVTTLPMVVAVVHPKLEPSGLLLLGAAFLLISLRYSLMRFEMFQTGILSLFAFGKTAGVFLLWYVTWRLMGRRTCD